MQILLLPHQRRPVLRTSMCSGSCNGYTMVARWSMEGASRAVRERNDCGDVDAKRLRIESNGMVLHFGEVNRLGPKHLISRQLYRS